MKKEIQYYMVSSNEICILILEVSCSSSHVLLVLLHLFKGIQLNAQSMVKSMKCIHTCKAIRTKDQSHN
jgi:hypothetical protein